MVKSLAQGHPMSKGRGGIRIQATWLQGLLLVTPLIDTNFITTTTTTIVTTTTIMTTITRENNRAEIQTKRRDLSWATCHPSWATRKQPQPKWEGWWWVWGLPHVAQARRAWYPHTSLNPVLTGRLRQGSPEPQLQR